MYGRFYAKDTNQLRHSRMKSKEVTYKERQFLCLSTEKFSFPLKYEDLHLMICRLVVESGQQAQMRKIIRNSYVA